jgi:hypothetical protein
MVAADAPAGTVAEWTLIADAAAPRFPDRVMTVDPRSLTLNAIDMASRMARWRRSVPS